MGPSKFEDDDRDSSEHFLVLVDILYGKGRFLAVSAASDLEELLTTPEAKWRLGRTVSRLMECNRQITRETLWVKDYRQALAHTKMLDEP